MEVERERERGREGRRKREGRREGEWVTRTEGWRASRDRGTKQAD